MDDIVTRANQVSTHLATCLPSVMRWCGSIAKRARNFRIALPTKSSGSPETDALTPADLIVQEVLISALRDSHPTFRTCRILAEEDVGDLSIFAADADLAIAIDPIDGTKQYRDYTGNGYATILTLQSNDAVHFSLVFLPESGEYGAWVYATNSALYYGSDNPGEPAEQVIRKLQSVTALPRLSPKIYMIGFQEATPERCRDVTKAGLEGIEPDKMPGSIYELLATGEFAGSLIHTPNVYDFPVSMQQSKILGGNAVWVHNRKPVNFRSLWVDERANMLRLPGIVACSPYQDVLDVLCRVAAHWPTNRYSQ